MSQTISITNKWQVSIPVGIRKSLKLKRPSLADVEAKNGRIIITPKRSEIFKLAGSLAEKQKKVKLDIDHIRDYIDYSDL